MKPRVKPIKRTNPSGQTVWIARIPLKDGGRRSAGTFRLKGPCKDPGPDCCAQHAIDHAIDREYGTAPRRAGTVGTYAKTWTRKHPRSKRTNDTNDHRLSRVLDLRLEGVRLRDWEFAELRRRHAALRRIVSGPGGLPSSRCAGVL